MDEKLPYKSWELGYVQGKQFNELDTLELSYLDQIRMGQCPFSPLLYFSYDVLALT